MGDLSPHFDRREFDCHDGTPASPAPELIAALERLRSICANRPMRIVSGFRTIAYNRAVGGAPESQHIHNRAADLVPGYATVGQAQAAGFTGIGYCGGSAVHVDVRPRPLAIFQDC
jgi:zinc D-Ala-D-Ala carboxypeptidase